MNSLSKILIPSLFVVFITAGCSEDFLDRPSLTDISADNFYQTTDELRLATAALYAGGPWGEWTYTCYFPVGDVLSGNMVLGYNGDAIQFNTFSVTDQNTALTANWKSMYKVIAHCNTTINNISAKAPSSIPDLNKNAAIAEARFIRAFAYFNLAMLWKDVPIIENNDLLITSPLVNRHDVNDVYQFIVNDLTFAAEHLPVSDKGRVTTWSAHGLLAKVYLTWAGLKSPSVGQRDEQLLALAKFHAGHVCNNSGLELLPNYADLFKTQFNDNEESLFALQWHPNGSWLTGNMLQLYSSIAEISAAGAAGWFGISPTYDIFLQYTEADSIRRKATFMLEGDFYPELDAAGATGDKGFRFLGETALKKHIVGTRLDNNSPLMTNVSSPEHNALLRLADVYLLYAEAILGNSPTTTDAEAIKFFNLVRKRAGVDELGPNDAIDADMLLRERRIEFAAEGLSWFDIVRLYYYDNQKAINFLNTQKNNRVPFSYDPETGEATAESPVGDITDASAGTFRFPLPPSEVTANPYLSDAPEAYTFKD